MQEIEQGSAYIGGHTSYRPLLTHLVVAAQRGELDQLPNGRAQCLIHWAPIHAHVGGREMRALAFRALVALLPTPEMPTLARGRVWLLLAVLRVLALLSSDLQRRAGANQEEGGAKNQEEFQDPDSSPVEEDESDTIDRQALLSTKTDIYKLSLELIEPRGNRTEELLANAFGVNVDGKILSVSKEIHKFVNSMEGGLAEQVKRAAGGEDQHQ